MFREVREIIHHLRNEVRDDKNNSSDKDEIHEQNEKIKIRKTLEFCSDFFVFYMFKKFEKLLSDEITEVREKICEEKCHQKDNEEISEKICTSSKKKPSKYFLEKISIEDNSNNLRDAHVGKITNYKII